MFAGEVRERATRTERRLFLDGWLESSRAPHDATPDILPLPLRGVLLGDVAGRVQETQTPPPQTSTAGARQAGRPNALRLTTTPVRSCALEIQFLTTSTFCYLRNKFHHIKFNCRLLCIRNI